MWKEKISLQPGEILTFVNRREKGTMGQTEVEQWSVVDGNGQEVGSVKFTEATSIKPPFKRSYHLMHQDISGALRVDERWEA